MENIIGSHLLKNTSTGLLNETQKPIYETRVVGLEILSQYKFVAFYFGTNWDPVCRKFTEDLIEFINQTNQVTK